ncbi:ABC transporter permease [Methylogaea oryzae]|uniref:Sulfonate ABC transporter n=1 Tax=Methylogaea oryzae TaxID=1295382 RepID=A0A8D5AKB6_9GAMM|nr:ABC transporter permease [Methylogaea oryzae]BBL70951.1 sulfonate ABC transporter [Methylogaea oryzae]
MMERHLKLSALGLLLFFAAWETLARSGIAHALLVPPPSRVPEALMTEIDAGIWFKMIGRSFVHYAFGLLAGSLLGIAMGTTAAIWPRLAAATEWVVRLLRPIPAIAWIPFAIIWFGVTETAASFIIAITVFWLNFFASYAAVRSVDKDLLEMARAFGQGDLWPRLAKVLLPAASPGILAGFRSGLGQGWMSVVAAEMFGIPGVGLRMMEASGLLATHVVVLYMLTIAALYGLSDSCFVLLQKRMLAWQR